MKQKWEPNQRPSIFISIPCIDRAVDFELSLRLLQWSKDPQLDLTIKYYPSIAPLDNARNIAVREFLDTDCEYFFHIDNDIVPPVETLRQLLRANKEIVAPLCLITQRDDKGILFPMGISCRYDENKEYKPYYGEGLEEVDIITGGCQLIRREVFLNIKSPYRFVYDENGIVTASEDFYFCKKAQEHGYKLFTDYELICKHIKLVDLKDINDLMVTHGR